MNEKIECRVCGEKCHSIQLHLSSEHPDMTLNDYTTTFPDAPVFSEAAKNRIEESQRVKRPRKKVVRDGSKHTLHEAFGLGFTKEVKTSQGEPIPISIVDCDEEWKGLIPVVDENYVYDIEVLKNTVMALELNIPLYLYGHAGTGKTCCVKNVCAVTRRPLLRVQHTVNTEETNITGNWTVKGKETVFELGPLPLAMKYGWVYLADEYDFALPSVLAVYQPVLEGEPLVIKEADAENRIIRPHPNFRFVATGNTNGSGDESGLYQGTSIQNAANYDRFNMVIEVDYMPKDKEVDVLMKQADISKSDAAKLVDFANRIRDEYNSSKLSSPISPRALISIARIGFLKGSYQKGIDLAFANKLSQVDKGVVRGLAQRIFG